MECPIPSLVKAGRACASDHRNMALIAARMEKGGIVPAVSYQSGRLFCPFNYIYAK